MQSATYGQHITYKSLWYFTVNVHNIGEFTLDYHLKTPIREMRFKPSN